MQLFVIIGVIIIFYVINKEKFQEKDPINSNDIENNGNSNSKLKKFFYGLILFIPLFIMYYFIIAMISGFIIYIIASATDGAWAYTIILGLAGSPIFTILTISRILNKNKIWER